jgi:hypothetical protein
VGTTEFVSVKMRSELTADTDDRHGT